MNDERTPDAGGTDAGRSDGGDAGDGSPDGRGTGAGDQAAAPREKAAIFQESQFTVEEGFAYKAFRTGAIWMNKLFLSSVVLLGVWLLLGLVMGEEACAASFQVVETANGTTEVPSEQCSVWLSTTSLYLGGMAIFTFGLQMVFGFLGLIVGKNIFEVTPAREEVGARRDPTGDGEDERVASNVGPPQERDGPDGPP